MREKQFLRASGNGSGASRCGRAEKSLWNHKSSFAMGDSHQYTCLSLAASPPVSIPVTREQSTEWITFAAVFTQ